jgi:hypothetical protein
MQEGAMVERSLIRPRYNIGTEPLHGCAFMVELLRKKYIKMLGDIKSSEMVQSLRGPSASGQMGYPSTHIHVAPSSAPAGGASQQLALVICFPRLSFTAPPQQQHQGQRQDSSSKCNMSF